ncbi:electron transport complex subunit RsxD [Testudinibacter sp. TR-2022]|uniref:electron transport complex subunit RsxD n=1 Tax=Testudinibacter sp. TR-2022 TaxID=2585029 RepID=UPI00111A35ED|nr:electron transport complex subunit RsxD [Testudinibacter sp. TR-2022]TNH04609.1 electron transport complex subunit RsxD [Pasteurellaceae bacterium Phil11]TNH22320.1 electron transport complex subunit RsxD [Testudinibacter sp. TR-2022]TNH23671.1 electron transport complex subunit RsxD [Testudinibacter sp. TR-2022]
MFKMTSSPHTHSSNLTARFMLWVIAAMLPAIAVQLYYFGVGVLIQIVLAASFAYALELVVTLLRRKPIFFYVADFSVILTALILAVAIPPYAPYWIILIGTFCAVILGKHVYGGLGQNPFNPAMVGYVVLLISFPLQMTSWMPPITLLHEPPTWNDAISLIFNDLSSDGYSLLQLVGTIDGISQATPLDSIKSGLHNQQSLNNILHSPIFNRSQWFDFLGTGWWQLNLAFLLGGLLLLWKKIIHWQIPTALLLSLTLLSAANWLLAPQIALNPLAQLLSGATMFCAFFIATDPVTASITPKGKLVFGALVGFLIYIIRYYGNYPDAVAFAILLANISVPLIDHYTRPRVYGYRVNNLNK